MIMNKLAFYKHLFISCKRLFNGVENITVLVDEDNANSLTGLELYYPFVGDTLISYGILKKCNKPAICFRRLNNPPKRGEDIKDYTFKDCTSLYLTFESVDSIDTIIAALENLKAKIISRGDYEK